MARIIQTSVSDVIQNRLSDPRIGGMISVTRVEISADLRAARVFLSIVGVSEAQQELCLRAIRHAHGFIQTHLADALTMKICPTLQFVLDHSLKKGFEITKILDALEAQRLAQQDAAPAEPPNDSESLHER